jgi:hypothetical protein
MNPFLGRKAIHAIRLGRKAIIQQFLGRKAKLTVRRRQTPALR